MKPESSKKTIVLRELKLIDAMIDDFATASHRTGSSVYEELLLQSLLPRNATAASIVRTLYDSGINHAFEEVWQFLAAGANWEATAPNARPLVELYRSLSIRAQPPTGTEPERFHVADQLDSIATLLERCGSDEAAVDAASIRQTISDLPTNLHPASLVGLILNNWESLHNYSRTYRLLADMSRIQNGTRSNAEDRCRFVQVLHEVSSEWQT